MRRWLGRMISGAGLAIAAIAASGSAVALTAPEVSRTERAEVRLVLDHDVLAPGQRAALALHQALIGSWHTYWKNPGDSGLAPTIAWTAPEGVEIGPIQWPRPSRIPFPPLMNYGFSEEAVLISEITLPEDWPAGTPVEISAQADWLICREICVPEAQSFTLSIPTAADPVVDAAAAEVVARGRGRHPVPAPELELAYATSEAELTLAVMAPEFATGALEDVYFYPADWGVVNHAAPQPVDVVEGALRLTLPKGDAWLSGEIAGPISGVLSATDPTSGAPVEIALAVTAEPGLPASLAAATPLPGGSGGQTGAPPAATVMAVLGAAGLAFLGGIILNLMPCVFPVLALKAVSFARASAGGRRAQIGEGLAYGAGVLASFLAIAAVLIALKSGGSAVGWGFQLQSPVVVALLAYVFVAVGLNLSGVYEISGRLAGLGGRYADRGGPVGSFSTGVLAVVVASPCTAPFMGAAMGFALTQSVAVTLVVFLGLALGFALPIVVLSLMPAVSRALPRPGAWMERLRQALAFPMYLAAAWLLWILGKLAGVDVVFAALTGLVLLALAAWALGAGAPVSPGGRRAAAVAACLALIGAGAALVPTLQPPLPAGEAREARIADGAEPYTPARLAALRQEGRPVFVNFTADWCISCKVNERLVLAGEGFRASIDAAGAVYMIGDWTRRDDEILAVLKRFGRAGVPLYLVYPADGSAPEVLPQVLTPGLVSEALARAATSLAAAPTASPQP